MSPKMSGCSWPTRKPEPAETIPAPFASSKRSLPMWGPTPAKKLRFALALRGGARRRRHTNLCRRFREPRLPRATARRPLKSLSKTGRPGAPLWGLLHRSFAASAPLGTCLAVSRAPALPAVSALSATESVSRPSHLSDCPAPGPAGSLSPCSPTRNPEPDHLEKAATLQCFPRACTNAP